MLAPMDVLDAGRMAVLVDPVGAVVGLWQPGSHNGAALVSEPGAMTWNELACRDPERAKSFYGNVFGWNAVTHPMGDTSYTEWKLDGRPVGGMVEMNDQWPPDVPPHWMTYFAVSDCDASAERAVALGGTVAVSPTDIPQGRFAMVGDTHGAFFSIMALSQPPG
jgi:predicted enzyme related to lactoylglutathione lyase